MPLAIAASVHSILATRKSSCCLVQGRSHLPPCDVCLNLTWEKLLLKAGLFPMSYIKMLKVRIQWTMHRSSLKSLKCQVRRVCEAPGRAT